MDNNLADYLRKYGIGAIAALVVLIWSGTQTLMAQNVTSGVYGEPPVNVQEQAEVAAKPIYVDMNDYYYLSNGEVASFLRQKNTYVLIQDRSQIFSQELSDSVKDQFDPTVKVLSKHSFGDNVMIEIKDEQETDSIISLMYQRYPSISFISPVLTSKQKGSTLPLAVQPQIVVRIAADADPQEAVELLQSMNLSLISKLKFTEVEFNFEITEPIYDIGRIFEMTREIANLDYVDWAEPNFLATAQKFFTPNDPLYNQQWHLNNTGQNNAVTDADIDAPEGWNISKGSGAVIAVYDDGVQLNHPDLRIWSNPGETGDGKESNGIDDDLNGYTDDYRGWDFNSNDNDPSPVLYDDDHGTAVAGVAAATGNNGVGVAGSAIDAWILPIRSQASNQTPCSEWANAMRYAGKYADVVNCSWGSFPACQSTLDSAIDDVVNGKIAGARRGTKGTPVICATGNSASGWQKYTLINIPAGEYEFVWKFKKDGSMKQGYDTVWIDNISWPGGGATDFESDTVGAIPSGFTSDGGATWSVVSDGIHARGATGKSVKAGSITDDEETNLKITKSVGAGTLTYWFWVSCEAPSRSGTLFDFFEFYVGGIRFVKYAPAGGTHTNGVSHPASNPNTIAVGASTDGAPGSVEERSAYSQFGPELDVVACSSGGGQRITTTDRTGTEGYNPDPEVEDLSDLNYTRNFGGTSSAAPLVSGIVADILAYKPHLTAAQVRQKLQEGTDKIGPYAYPNGRNDYYGYGRVNLFKTLKLIKGNGTIVAPVNSLLLSD